MMVRVRRPVVVVVGTGMAGGRLVEEILARKPDRFDIRMFGAEPHGTYNRILLSHVLGGDHDPKQLWLNSLDWYKERGIFVHAGIKAEKIDCEQRVVYGAGDKVAEPYDYLVLATGSRPFVPPIEGVKQKGVFVFRTLEDCTEIAGCAQESDRAIVLGGGLLGLEAAKGLSAHGVSVTVVEAGPHLMAQQLDAVGGALLKRKMELLGIEVLTGVQATKILGDGVATGLQLADGSSIPADMVVISCGIRPNVETAQQAGLKVERGIVVNDQLQTSDPHIYAVGECVQHRGQVYGLVEPVWEQARVAASVLIDEEPTAAYTGSRLGTTLKVMGVDLTSMGSVTHVSPDCEMVSRLDPQRGVYKKLIVREGRIEGAILLGEPDHGGRWINRFKNADPVTADEVEALIQSYDEGGNAIDVAAIPDTQRICNCNDVSKGRIVLAIREGNCSVEAVGKCTKAGTGCGSCQGTVAQLIEAYGPAEQPKSKNKIEVMKDQLGGMEALPQLLDKAATNHWKGLTEDDKQRWKWHGVFFRKPTPGHFMMRLRFVSGQSHSAQWRVLADVSDEFGKGFCDLTTRQQIQLRWFTLGNIPEIWDRLEKVGLHSKQTGMDNIRGLCGCPLGGLTPEEAFDATPTAMAYDRLILNNPEFTNLPRKFNVTITGCLENCTHAETQDIGLVPASRENEVGFNVVVGGKQGSGGYRPGTPLDVFLSLDEAVTATAEMTRIFRDHGSREQRNRARLAFLIEDKGIRWFRGELEKRLTRKLAKAGADLRKPNHHDHIGIHPQKPVEGCEPLYYAGLLVPVGRITTQQMRAVADLADQYGDGRLLLTTSQNVIVPNIPASKLVDFQAEPILQELSPNPSEVMRGLVVCTGSDYCHMALIDTKAWALETAKELDRRTAGRKLKPLTIHWSGCPASCGMHQISTIGLQGCRSRVNNQIVDAAHVYLGGRTGPKPQVATDLMYDVPCTDLADALEPIVAYAPR